MGASHVQAIQRDGVTLRFAGRSPPGARCRRTGAKGRKLLHYEILEKLGEGGMGWVWKARDTHLNRMVAIKVLPSEKVSDASRKQRFVHEARAASALNHPNIVVIHDIARADGVDFIVMEQVSGATLDRRIPRHGMRLAELLDIAIQIADALVAAHAAGIVHRDLKPGNIGRHSVWRLCGVADAQLDRRVPRFVQARPSPDQSVL